MSSVDQVEFESLSMMVHWPPLYAHLIENYGVVQLNLTVNETVEHYLLGHLRRRLWSLAKTLTFEIAHFEN